MTAIDSPPATSAALLTVDDVAAMLSISTRQVWRMADAGTLPAPIRIGAKLCRWPVSEINKWLADQARAATRRR